MMAYLNPIPIILDNGGSTIKAGFGNESLPRIVTPSTVGRKKYGGYEVLIGHQAQRGRGILNLNYPISNGIVTDWNDMEKIWSLIFSELNCFRMENPILVTEPASNPSTNKERIVEIMFEKFQVPGLYIATQEALSLYSSGLTTGLVLQSGDGVTNAVPIIDGKLQSQCIIRSLIAGRSITEYLRNILTERGYSFYTSSEMEVVKDIKEKLGLVSLDFIDSMRKAAATNVSDTNYQLPDGRIITLGNERFRATEVLFQPAFLGSKSVGIPKAIFNSILMCGKCFHKELFGNIVISGGSTYFPNFCNRVHNELMIMVPPTMKILLHVDDDRHLSAWKGGSILTSLNTFQRMWALKQEYLECGAEWIIRKYF